MNAVSSIGWAPLVLLAVAALLCRARKPPGRHHRVGARPRAPRHELSASQLGAAAGLASALGCIAVGGWPSGFVAAAGASPVAVLALRKLAGRARAPGSDATLPLALDLAAVVLQSGQTVPAALSLVAPVTASGAVFDRVAGLLRLGAEPVDAWSAVAGDSPVRPVARAAIRSEVSGARLAVTFERCAELIRIDLDAAGVARATRAGTSALAPLALCFLPSFVCLGIVPAVVGIAGSALRQVV